MYGVIYAECDVRPVSPIRRSPQFMPPYSSWFALRSSGRVIPGLRGTNVLIVAQSRLAVALDLEIGCSDAHSPNTIQSFLLVIGDCLECSHLHLDPWVCRHSGI